MYLMERIKVTLECKLNKKKKCFSFLFPVLRAVPITLEMLNSYYVYKKIFTQALFYLPVFDACVQCTLFHF